MRKQWLAMLGTAVLFTGCAEQTESEPLSTIPTEPVVYEDTGKSVIHAGYYGENKKVYINKATSIAGAEKTNPDYEIETSYDYDGRKTEICVYTYNGEEKTLLKYETYAYDENDMLIASGGTAGYCAIAKLPGSKYDLRYIQAWLNHPYTEKLFQIMGSDFEGGFTARGTYLLKKIPFVELDLDDEKQKALYESVLISTKKINELNIALEQKKDKASISVIEAEKKNLSKQIEDNITKIYNLQF